MSARVVAYGKAASRRHEATRARVRLDASILARAVRGEPVPQDPADEPARLLPPHAAARPARTRAAPSAAPA